MTRNTSCSGSASPHGYLPCGSTNNAKAETPMTESECGNGAPVSPLNASGRVARSNAKGPSHSNSATLCWIPAATPSYSALWTHTHTPTHPRPTRAREK